MKETKKIESGRPIDKLAGETYSWWKKTFLLIKKTETRTWKLIFITAFALGTILAIIWSVGLYFHNFP